MSEYQEEVLTNLLDLQAELRGDEPEPHDGPTGRGHPRRIPRRQMPSRPRKPSPSPKEG